MTTLETALLREFGWDDSPADREAARDTFRQVLAALGAAGCVVVPREPTEAMHKAGEDQFMCRSEDAWEIWRAMLSAAPDTLLHDFARMMRRRET